MDEPTAAEIEAIDLLSLLIKSYEKEHYPLPKASPVEVLRFLMDRYGLWQRDLGEVLGCSGATVWLILAGARNLTVPHTRALAERFHVQGSVFLG